MAYKISGSTTENSRIIVINESDWSIDTTQPGISEAFEVTGITEGKKTILARTNLGKISGVGNINPIEYNSGHAAGTYLFGENSNCDYKNVTKDAMIYGELQTNNYGGLWNIQLGLGSNSNRKCHGLMSFSVKDVLEGTTIQSATLNFYIALASGSNFNFSVSQCLRSWAELSCNWLYYDAGSAWQVAGAQGTADKGSRLHTVGTNNGWKSLDITSVVQSWIDGTKVEGGVVFIPDTYQINWYANIYGKLSADGNRPYLEVTI